MWFKNQLQQHQHHHQYDYLQGYVVVGYRGTFAFGRDMSDVKVNIVINIHKTVSIEETF